MINNSKSIVTLFIILVLVALGIYFMTKPSPEEGNAMIGKEDIVMEKDGVMTENGGKAIEGESMMKKGSYEPYAPEKLALADTGKVVLFFRASWCPTCRNLDADIHANLDSIPEGVVILDVDYDNSTALKQKYGVTYQHTLVQVDSSGNQIAKWSKSPTLSSLLSELR